jgi:hypothetical protein
MEKPFACERCRKRFSRSDNLGQHLKVHKREGAGGALGMGVSTQYIVPPPPQAPALNQSVGVESGPYTGNESFRGVLPQQPQPPPPPLLRPRRDIRPMGSHRKSGEHSSST